jgi:hypothetical protein
VAEENMWLWRVTWHKGRCYGVGYATDGRELVRLYNSPDGRKFSPLVDELFSKRLHGKGQPNETSLVFQEDDTCLCLLRRDADTATAQLGTARPPYLAWTWKDLGIHLGGPHMIRMPLLPLQQPIYRILKNRPTGLIVAGRLVDGPARTALLWLDPQAGTLDEILTLPSGGDTSYPGLAWHAGRLWVSYYASHEGKTSIYLAQIEI